MKGESWLYHLIAVLTIPIIWIIEKLLGSDKKKDDV